MIVVISKKLEFVSIFMDIYSQWVFSEILPECPMIPLYLPIVLWGIGGISFVLYSESDKKVSESFSKLRSTIRTYGLYRKRWRVYEIENKLHTRTYTLFRVNSWEDKSTTVINCIILNFSSTASKRKANIQLYFSSWLIKCIECFTSLFPFSFSLVANSRSWENSIDSGLIKWNLCFFLKLPWETPWSKLWISSCEIPYHLFYYLIGSIHWNILLRSTPPWNHSSFSFYTIAS